MNKKIAYLRFILLNLVVILSFFVLKDRTTMFGISKVIYAIVVIIFYLLTIKDIILKEPFQFNKKYNILSILTFLMMIIILSRCLFDQHFVYNDKEYLKEIIIYERELSGEKINEPIILDPEKEPNLNVYIDIIESYFRNNIVFFIIMFVLLDTYRGINLTKKITKRIK